jgi:phage tail sheath protein FI
MPEYLAPGVYVEEVPSSSVAISVVSSSTAGMVGLTERGPLRPRMVTGWGDYQAWFGGLIDPGQSFFPWSAKGFFENGGQRLFVARAVRSDAVSATLDHPTSAAPQTLLVQAMGPGAWGNNIFLRIQPGDNFDPLNPPPRPPITVTVLYYQTPPPLPLVDPFDAGQIANANRRVPDVVERYENVGWHPSSADYFIPFINSRSKLIDIDWGDDTQPPARPDDLAFAQLDTLAGDDGVAPLGAADLLGDSAVPPGTRTGLAGLGDIDEIAILAVPDHANGTAFPNVADRVSLRNELINQCELLGDRFAVVSVEAGQGDVSTIRPPRDTSYAAFYAPWIRVFDPRTSDTILMPPSGHIAGLYAKVDVTRGVHKAPANEVLQGIMTTDINATRKPLEFAFGKREQDILNPRHVNVIRDFRSDRRDIRVYGARTMSSDATWRYLSVRRLANQIKESLDEGTQWVVFEPNDEPLWSRLRLSIRAFLNEFWLSGALQGTKADEAYFVRCDRSTMTQANIDNGQLICQLGIAPVKPAEFVILRLEMNVPKAN